MKKLPKKIKIGSRIYTIKFKKRLLASDGVTRLAGQVNHSSRVIKIDPRRHDDAKRDTLLHEVIHACCDLVELDHDEKFVDAFAGAFSAALNDNPKFLKLWRKKCKP